MGELMSEWERDMEQERTLVNSPADPASEPKTNDDFDEEELMNLAQQQQYLGNMSAADIGAEAKRELEALSKEQQAEFGKAARAFGARARRVKRRSSRTQGLKRSRKGLKKLG